MQMQKLRLFLTEKMSDGFFKKIYSFEKKPNIQLFLDFLSAVIHIFHSFPIRLDANNFQKKIDDISNEN